ncbi:MAG: hypothetical protein V2I33_02215 [Kangiellaceae bacterium]|jgi:hypothetical protein|nr:hypothetical protein [Kangiellaceae bacterium]
MESYLIITAATLASLALFFLIKALYAIKRLKLLSFGLQSLSGLLFATLALTASLVILNLEVYSVLSYEENVARLTVVEQSEQTMIIELTIDHQSPTTRRYRLSGDQIQIDVLFLKWRPFGQMLGLKPLYSLDRLKGRYVDIATARLNNPDIYSLQSDSLLVSAQFEQLANYLKWFYDVEYGSSVYRSVELGKTYDISISQTGLLIRQVEETNP